MGLVIQSRSLGQLSKRGDFAMDAVTDAFQSMQIVSVLQARGWKPVRRGD
jgi:hypothetical protein